MRARLFLGWTLLSCTVVWALGTACTCDPSGPPVTATCTTSEVPTVSAVRVYVSLGGPELNDGDSLPIMFGGQGGSHLGFELELDGSGFGSCADVMLSVEGSDSFSRGVRVNARDGGVRTSQIVIFPGDTSGCHAVTASAYGVTRRVTLGTCGAPDAGTDAPTFCGDGIAQAGEECDVLDPPVCRSDCRVERCDGTHVPGESCFRSEMSLPSDEVLAMGSRETSAGSELVTAVRRTDGTFALELRSETLDPITSFPLPFEPGRVIRADRDGDDMEDDVIILSADGTRLIEGHAAGALPFELMPEVALTPTANLTLPIAACDVDGNGTDDVIFGAGESIQLVSSPLTTWVSPARASVVEIGCVAGSPYGTVLVATADAIELYQEAPDGSVPLLDVIGTDPHPRLLPIASMDLVLGLGSSPELLNRMGLVGGGSSLPSVSSAAWVLRDGRTVLGVIDDAGAIFTTTLSAGATTLYPNALGFVGTEIVGLGNGTFVVYVPGRLTRFVPSE